MPASSLPRQVPLHISYPASCPANAQSRSYSSVGFVDVLPKSMDSCRSHQAHILLVHLLWLLCHLLGWVPLSCLPWCVLSMLCNTTHVTTMSLTTFGLCSIAASSTQNMLAMILNKITTVSCLVLQGLTGHGIKSKALSSIKNSANLALPPPGIQISEAPRCHSISLPSTCCS